MSVSDDIRVDFKAQLSDWTATTEGSLFGTHDFLLQHDGQKVFEIEMSKTEAHEIAALLLAFSDWAGEQK